MAILKIENIRKRFGKTEILKGVSMSVEKGEIVAIIGSSGSGKTTFLRCINFLEKADEGTILADGKVIFDAKTFSKLTLSQIRESQLNFGMVFQSFNLFPQYTALNNVMLAPGLLAKEREDYKQNKKEILAEIEKNAKELLAKVGLADKMDYYPCQLSGGQQQRVSIARALALNPKVLFFDEPTSALDPELTGEILNVIRDLAKKRVTMVIVTHEIDFARNVADRIVFMSDGAVLEEGTPQEVLDNPKHAKIQSFLQKLSDR